MRPSPFARIAGGLGLKPFQSRPPRARRRVGQLGDRALGRDAPELHEVRVVGESRRRRAGCARRCTPCALAPALPRPGRASCRPTWCRCRTRARRAAAHRPRWPAHARATRAWSARSDSAPAGTSAKSSIPTKPSHSIALSRWAFALARRPASRRRQLDEVLAGLVLHRRASRSAAQEMRLNSRTSWNERTRPDARATLSGESPTSSSPFSFTAPRSGADEPGQQVEHGRLAGAVGADERGDGALAQIDVEVLGGDDAAEAAW